MSAGDRPAAGGGEAGGAAPSRGALGWVRWVGLALTLAGCAWVAAPLLRQAGELRGQVAGGRLLAAAAAGAVGYAVLSTLLAASWWWGLAAYGRRPPLRLAWAVWARAQLGKYLPGNVFHYVGRQLMGRRLGLGHASLAAAGVVELVSVLVAAGLLGGAGALARHRGLGGLGPLVWVPAVALLAVAGLVLLDALARRLPLLLGSGGGRTAPPAALPRLSGRRLAALLVPAVALNLGFLAGSGALLYLLLVAGWPAAEVGLVRALWVYPLAWAAGTLTLGAPAGLGVREAILALELGGAMGAAPAALLAVALRLVTVGGDLLVAGLGWLLGPGPAADAPRAAADAPARPR